MSRRTVIILVVLAALLSLFSLSLSRRDSSDWRSSRARRLFPFPWLAVNSVRIERPGEEPVAFEKTWAGEWQILLDGDLRDSLNPQAVEELSALVMLPWRESAPDLPVPDPDQSVAVTAAAATGESVRILFGGVRQNLRSAGIAGDPDAVYGVNQDLAKILDWPRERFRNLNLLAAPVGGKPVRVTMAPGPEGKVVLERRESGWTMPEPVEWPVEASRLDMLLRWMDNLRADSIAAEMTGDAEWFGFTPESAYVEAAFVVHEGTEVVRRLEIGKPSIENEQDAYVRVAGRNPVFTVSRQTLEEISLELGRQHPRDWANFYRQRSLNLLRGEMPSKFVVERLLPEPATLTLEALGGPEDRRWQGTLDEGGEVRRFAVDPPTAEETLRPLTALVTGLSRFRIKYFLADQAPGPETARWTAHPAWRFSSTSPAGTANPTLTLYAADAEGNLPSGAPFVEGEPGPAEIRPLPGMPEFVGIAASIGGSPAVMEMFADLSYLLCLPPYRYQSKRVIDSDPRDWTRIEVEEGSARRAYFRKGSGMSEQWWREDGEPLMDDNNRFVIAVMALSQLQALGFAAEKPDPDDKFGLDQPVITAIVYGDSEEGGEDGRAGESDEPLFRLAIGGRVGETGAYYASLDGDGPVFLIPNSIVEALREEYR